MERPFKGQSLLNFSAHYIKDRAHTERVAVQRVFRTRSLRSSADVIWHNPRNKFAQMISHGHEPADVKQEIDCIKPIKLHNYLSPELQNCLLVSALCSEYFPEYLRYFLHQGIDVDAGSPRFSPVLHWAIERRDYHAVDLLLSVNADFNIGVEVWDGMRYHKNALTVALHMDDVSLMRTVLDRVDPTKLKVQGRTALHMACVFIAYKCIGYLLSEISCSYFYLDEIMFILGIGLPQVPDTCFSTYTKLQLGLCLHGILTSIYFERCLKKLLVIVELMLHEGVDINFRYNEETPIEALIRLHTVNDRKIVEMVNFLLSRGAYLHMSKVKYTIRETINYCYFKHMETGQSTTEAFAPFSILGMEFWYLSNAKRIIHDTLLCPRDPERFWTRVCKPYEILIEGNDFPVGSRCQDGRELLRLLIINFGNKYHKNVREFASSSPTCGCYKYAAQLFLANQQNEMYQLITQGLNHKSSAPIESDIYVPPIRSLKELSRVQILGQLRIPKYASVETLDLPARLQRYVIFQEESSVFTPEWIQKNYEMVSKAASEIRASMRN